MIAPERREMLELLVNLSEAFPEQRLGQLVANLSYLAKEPTNEAIWDVEDRELVAAARELLARRTPASASVA